MRSLFLLSFLAITALALGEDVYPVLEAGGRTYRDVRVLSANASSLSIKHSGGISQLALADLSAELQAKYGYAAAADAARTRKLEQMRQSQALAATVRVAKLNQQLSERRGQDVSGASVSVREAFARFGSEPTLNAELDLREKFRSHGIGVRSQMGPSCSIHAIAAALEYQFAEEKGRQINVSERYLVEATSRSLGRASRNDLDAISDDAAAVEEGFTLEQVFQAIRGHGLAIELSPVGRNSGAEDHAFEDINFSPFQVPGARTRAGVANIAHVLNAQMPIVVGLAWPHGTNVGKTALLSKQRPAKGAGHAVTIVGYRCPTGKLEEAKFIFRNSWGNRWGAGGYGFFTYEYLLNNLWSSYVVELR